MLFLLKYNSCNYVKFERASKLFTLLIDKESIYKLTSYFNTEISSMFNPHKLSLVT